MPKSFLIYLVILIKVSLAGFFSQNSENFVIDEKTQNII